MGNIVKTSCLSKQYKGYFDSAYRVAWSGYKGHDYGHRSVIFSGQGTVFPGMFAGFFDTNSRLKSHFYRADLLAKKYNLPSLTDYIFNPNSVPEEHVLVVRILCLFTLELALFDSLCHENIRPNIITSHSFGEFVALVAAGIISFEDMFGIIHHRETHSPAAHSIGIMLVAYAGRDTIDEVLQQETFPYYFSNANSPYQTAVSVATAHIERLEKALGHSEIKTNRLHNVPCPYHTPLMLELSQSIEQYLRENPPKIKPPVIPVFTCGSRKLINAEDFDANDVLDVIVRQVIDPVDFILQIETLVEMGVMHFIEIGPKSIYCQMVSDILREPAVNGRKEFVEIGEIGGIRGVVENTRVKTNFIEVYLNPERKKNTNREPINSQGKKILQVLNRAIGKVTGYELVDLSVEDNYQSELGIDSIKKAEILVTVLDELDMSGRDDMVISQHETLLDTVEYFQYADNNPVVNQDNVKRDVCFSRNCVRWIEQALVSPFLTDKHHDSEDTASEDGTVIVSVKEIMTGFSTLRERLDKPSSWHTLVITVDSGAFGHHLFNEHFLANLREEFYPIIEFFQYLLKITLTKKTLFLFGVETEHYLFQGLDGLLKSLRKDTDYITYKQIQIDSPIDETKIRCLVGHERYVTDVAIRYRQGKRWISQLQPAPVPITPVVLTDELVVVAIGGAKGITFSLLANLAKQYKLRLYLAGRSSAMEPNIQSSIETLKQSCLEVHYHSLDASQYKGVDNWLSDITMQQGEIDLLINGAGTVVIDRLQNKTPEKIDNELLNKVLPARNVLRAGLSMGISRVINFSSILARYGGIGQSIYSCANAIINGLTAEYNQQSKEGTAISINWPPWENTGMTEDRVVLNQLKQLGVSLLTPQVANELFLAELTSNEPEPVYYADTYDRMFYRFSPDDLEKIKKLYGNPTKNEVNNGLCFDRQFSVSNDRYLNDHKIKGVACVPAAIAMTQFLGCARLFLDDNPVLIDFEASNPLLVKDSVKTKLTLSVEEDKAANFKMSTSISHFSAKAKLLTSDHITSIINLDIVPAKLSENLEELDVNIYYEGNRKADFGLHHGPVFQMMERVFIDDVDSAADKLIVQIDNDALVDILESDPDSRLALWVDGAFQAMGLQVAYSHQLKTLPVKVGELILLPAKPSKKLYVYTKLINISESEVIGNVEIRNSESELVLLLRRVTMRAL